MGGEDLGNITIKVSGFLVDPRMRGCGATKCKHHRTQPENDFTGENHKMTCTFRKISLDENGRCFKCTVEKEADDD